MKKRVEWEHLEQSALIERVRLELEPKFPECKWLYAIPNEGGSGNAGRIRSGLMQAEGARKGVSDLCLPSPRLRPSGKVDFLPPVKDSKGTYLWSCSNAQFPCYMGLYIEMKPAPVISPVRQSVSCKPMKPEQKAFKLFVLSQGYAAFCCNGQDEGMAALIWYLNLNSIDPRFLWADMPIEFVKKECLNY